MVREALATEGLPRRCEAGRGRLSLRFPPPVLGGAGAREEFFSTSDFHRCVWGWRRHVEAARDTGRTLPAEQYVEIRYERLVSTPHQVGRKIAAYLDTRPSSRFRELLDDAQRDSVGRWTEELGPREIETARRESGRLLAELGYDG